MTRKNYVNVSLPETLIKKIDEVVNKRTLGYSSRAEFLKQAARELLEKLSKN